MVACRICFNPKPCIICYTRPRSVRLTCGHGVLCSQCWSQCKQAPGAPNADSYPAETKRFIRLRTVVSKLSKAKRRFGAAGEAMFIDGLVQLTPARANLFGRDMGVFVYDPLWDDYLSMMRLSFVFSAYGGSGADGFRSESSNSSDFNSNLIRINSSYLRPGLPAG